MKRVVYLNRQHFFCMLCVALAVHIVFGVAWALSPGLQVNKVPVHVLNIKLGSGDIMAMTDSSTGEEANKASVIKTATQPNPVPPPHEASREDAAEPEVSKTAKAPKKAATPPQEQAEAQAASEKGEKNAIHTVAPTGSAANAPLSSHSKPSQYVRRRGDERGAGEGSAIGNSVDSQAKMMQRYTQLISMWINRQKTLLTRAVPQGMRGNIVVRLRIDRAGKIHMFKLDKATGVPVVDSAAADMVRAANPVPPVPTDFPGGSMFEFLIPISYTSQRES